MSNFQSLSGGGLKGMGGLFGEGIGGDWCFYKGYKRYKVR